jgi:hypothetical protein
MFLGFILILVETEFTAPKKPARCNEMTARSTDTPVWATVHPVPVPAPLSTILLVRRRDRDGGNNQNLILFIGGNAMSGAPSINGTGNYQVLYSVSLHLPTEGTCIVQYNS